MDARVAIRSLARGALRRIVPAVYRRPWLVRLAGRAFVLMPSLKSHMREALVPHFAHAAPQALNDAQLRVLLDLRDAAVRESARTP